MYIVRDMFGDSSCKTALLVDVTMHSTIFLSYVKPFLPLPMLSQLICWLL